MGWKTKLTSVATARSVPVNKYAPTERQVLPQELEGVLGGPTQPRMHLIPSVSVERGAAASLQH